MRVFGMDPGNVRSAICIYNADTRDVEHAGIYENYDMRVFLKSTHIEPEDEFAVEMIASYGMPVGATVFQTCVWIGRFIEVIGRPVTLVYRKDVKMHLCNSTRAKDGNVRQALIDMFPATGGGKLPQVGTKAQPGPLYGFSKDMWAALGVAITYAETMHGKE